MSPSRRRRKPRADPGGRPLLALLSVVLIVAGILKSDQLVGLPLVLLGVLLAILYAFHSRIMGVRISDKIQLPMTAEMPEEREDSYDLPRLPQGGRPASLSEVSKAAHNPGSERHRPGGRERE